MSWRDDRFASILLKGGWLLCSLFLIGGGMFTIVADFLLKGGWTAEGGIIALTFMGVGALALCLYALLLR